MAMRQWWSSAHFPFSHSPQPTLHDVMWCDNLIRRVQPQRCDWINFNYEIIGWFMTCGVCMGRNIYTIAHMRGCDHRWNGNSIKDDSQVSFRSLWLVERCVVIVHIVHILACEYTISRQNVYASDARHTRHMDDVQHLHPKWNSTFYTIPFHRISFILILCFVLVSRSL